jgi:hypothetical protein
VERLEREKEALLEQYSRMVPEHLDALEPSERNRVYRMLDLSVCSPRGTVASSSAGLSARTLVEITNLHLRGGSRSALAALRLAA